ncbi:conserved hypothetical protein [Luminiphilus syltensis NOR5-1B]|uniref:DUF4381 domain-containing protein n=1 Tax=Luminiphilus syltensis NOR5-1B TaxID=565045 RepID=B8KRD1_9GAMM|nr:conserved hypothetical protein [Luminiphilus syltensis NOR5-1B]
MNLPDLMELLQGPVTPAPIPLIPATVGWVVLGLWLVAVVGLVAIAWVRRYRRNAYRRQALAMLKELAKRAEDNPAGVAEAISTIVKSAALQAYPRTRVAALTGSDWAVFLRDTSNRDPLVSAAAGQLARAAYQPNSEPLQLLEPALRWVKVHRA